MRTTTDGCFVCPSLFIVAPKRFSENKYSYKCHYSLRCCTSRVCAGSTGEKRKVGFMGIQHAGLLVDNVEKALEFYLNVLGMEDASKERPNLPYKGAFIQVGPRQQIHLMELPSVDPKTGRPAHGGRDRHIALQVENLSELEQRLEQCGHPFTWSKSGRRAIFCRDWDGNALEFMEATGIDNKQG